MRPLLLVACLAVFASVARSQTVLLHDGEIWTGDEAQPAATALVVAGERIVFVGDDDAARAFAGDGSGVQRIDLLGRRVLPGLIDSHVHFLTGGQELLSPDLRTADDAEEMARRLAEAAAHLPKGTWLTGGTWDHERWPGAQLPTAAVLDRHVPDHPVFVHRLDGHMAVANSEAMRRAKVTAAFPDPPGGTIVRDADGNPAGVFKDNAMVLIARHIPPWTDQERLRYATVALRHAAELGITGVHDMLDDYRALETFQQLDQLGALTARVTVYTPIASHDRWGAVRVRRGFGQGSMLRLGGLKGFADGALGSTTAWFFEPYDDAPDTRGLPMPALMAGGSMPDDVRGCTDLGLQVAIHAIGDRAIREMLDIFERGGAELRRLRPRIEHAQHIHADDLARFAALGVTASMQPYHAIDDGRWAEKRIGVERCRTTYAFGSLLEGGASLAFGSDWPVAPLSPWLGLYAAVTRRTLDGENPDGWFPEQKVDIAQALRAYTTGSATAAFDERELGTLAVGKLADLIVLDRDPLTIPAAELREVQVDLTMVGGRVVHRRESRHAARLRPEIVGRDGWGGGVADFRSMRPHRAERITLHHSGVAIAGWPDVDGTTWMRRLWRFSREDRGWGDVPYHFSVTPDGRVHAGRDARFAGDTNTRYDPSGHLLIEAVGDFGAHDPTPAQLDAIAQLCAWASVHFDIPLATLGGHRDFADTTCPGDRLYQRIDAIRADAAARVE